MNAAQLDYAPSRPRFSRRRLVQLSAICILAAIGVAGWRWWRPVSDRIAYLRLQRQCMNYTAPSGQIAFTTEPHETERLIESGYQRLWVSPPLVPFVMGIDGSGYLGAGKNSPALLKLLAPNYSVRDSVAFMHRRRAPDKHERLVVILVLPMNLDYLAGFRKVSMEPVPVFYSSKLRCNYAIDRLRISHTKYVRIFVGQSDPADESHFTILFDRDGKPGVIDGRLEDDDNVSLKIRNENQ